MCHDCYMCYIMYMTNTGWLACSKLIVSMQVPLHLVGVPFLLPLPLAPPTPHTMPHPHLIVESLVLIIINHFSLLHLPLTPPT